LLVLISIFGFIKVLNAAGKLGKQECSGGNSFMKRVIVTGGAGFIGSAFVWKLNQEGIYDILIVDDLKDSEKWKNLSGLRFSDYLHKDIFLHSVTANTITYAPEAVVHMGACSSTTERNADYLMENNYRFTRILAGWAVSRKIRFLYASSAATYGDGARGFSDEIDLFDLYAERSGLLAKIVGLKFFNVFGPNEYHKGNMASIVFKAFHQIMETGRVKLFKSHLEDIADGEQKRDFIYVKDCVDSMWWLLTHAALPVFLIRDQARRVPGMIWCKHSLPPWGRPPQIEYIAMPEALQKSYHYFTRASMERLKKAGCPLHYRSLEEGVRDYVVNHLQAKEPHLLSIGEAKTTRG
jgi:ADP-L-glycero-D-manno-heptose 6-epimerase